MICTFLYKIQGVLKGHGLSLMDFTVPKVTRRWQVNTNRMCWEPPFAHFAESFFYCKNQHYKTLPTISLKIPCSVLTRMAQFLAPSGLPPWSHMFTVHRTVYAEDQTFTQNKEQHDSTTHYKTHTRKSSVTLSYPMAHNLNILQISLFLNVHA